MSLEYDTDNLNSLQILLEKAYAIKTNDEENLAYIQSQKDQKVVMHHEGNLKTKCASPTKLNTQYSSDTVDTEVMTIDGDTTNKSVGKFIAEWTYQGKALIKEGIAMDELIDLKLERFDDLMRLHNEYGKLLEEYSHTLSDDVKSCEAMKIVLCNMEVLHEAIEDIYHQTLDIVNTTKANDAEKFFESLELTQLNLPETDISDIVDFNDCEKLSCMHTLSEHKGNIWALEPFDMNDKKYLASGGDDKMIKIWDLNSSQSYATFTSTSEIYTLVAYVKNGVQMLASGTRSGNILLWDLSSKKNSETLKNDNGITMSLIAHDGCLLSGNSNGTITVWDLDTYEVLGVIKEHKGPVNSLTVYHRQGKAYLASGSRDSTVKIFDFKGKKMLKSFSKSDANIVTIVDDGDHHLLVSAHQDGSVRMWNMDNDAIRSFQARSDHIQALQVMRCGGRVCVICPGNKRSLQVRDLKKGTIVTSFKVKSFTKILKVFMNGDRACVVSGHENGDINVWTRYDENKTQSQQSPLLPQFFKGFKRLNCLVK